MTDQEHIDDLERKVNLLKERQDEQAIQLNKVVARLTYLEVKQYRLMKELGIEPTAFEGPAVAQSDAQEILRAIPEYRLN